jgi:EpsG family
VLVYWVIFAVFAAGAFSYASSVSRLGLTPVSGSGAAVMNRRSVILLLTGVALTILIGLRYRVGGDWANYADLFRRMVSQDLFDALGNSGQEPGYTFLTWLAGELGAGIWLVNLICAIPFTYGLMQLCRQQPNPWLALLVATPFLIVVVGMGYTRQAAAMGCLMAGLSNIVDRKPPLRFIGWVLIGALFHRTVLVFVPVMFIAGTKNKLLAYPLAVVALILAYYTVLPSAMDQYGPGYTRSQVSASGATVRVMMDVLPAAMVLVFGRRFFWTAEERAVWRTYAILCIIAGAALPFIHSSAVVDRLAIYLIPMQIFVYARIGYAFGLIQRGWLMWTTAVMVYSAAVMFVWLNYAVNSFAWLPYKNYITAPQRA